MSKTPLSRRLLILASLATVLLSAGGCGWLTGSDNTTIEAPVSPRLSDEQAWQRLVAVMASTFQLERCEPNAVDNTSVIYTGWTRRAAGRDLGMEARVMVLLCHDTRRVRVMVEQRGPDGLSVPPPSNHPLLPYLRQHVLVAVGARPASGST